MRKRRRGVKEHGPYSLRTLEHMLRARKIDSNVQVREEGREEWVRLRVLLLEGSDEDRREVDVAYEHARLRANRMIWMGVIALGVGIGLTVVSLGFVLFYGLILAGAVQLVRGLLLRPSPIRRDR